MNAQKQVRVVIVEDDVAMRERLAHAIGAEPDLCLLAQFDCGRDALRWLEQYEADVLLVDLGLPDLPGMAVITYCVQRHPRTSVMVITMYEDEGHVMRSLEAGATGYLLKDSLREEIAERVRELASGGSPMSPPIARQVLRRLVPVKAPLEAPPVDTVSALTERELLVLTRIAQGFNYVEIAELEGISRHTVHAHIKNIYSKLAVHSKTEAVFEASRMGLLVSPHLAA
jgi:DNA-binding NarL/FixJ family response regulator